MGRLQGGEVPAYIKGQEKDDGGRRAGVQPHAGFRAREEVRPTVDCRRSQTLLPRLQAAVDRHHHRWAHAVAGAERTPAVPPREETGEACRGNILYERFLWKTYLLE